MSFTTVNELVEAFVLNGATEGQVGALLVSNDMLYSGTKPLARRGPQGFLLDSVLDYSVSDPLILAIAKSNSSFERIESFADLSAPAKRLADIDTGNYDRFKMIASLFGFEYKNEDLELFEKASAFRNRIKDFFTQVTENEREERRRIDLATKSEQEREATEKWDRGEGQARNGLVKGANGGLRIRLRESGSRKIVETSRGEKTGLTTVRNAWNRACRLWYTGETKTHDSYYGTSHRVEIRENTISMGCQTINKAEAERFADLQGWNRDGNNS